MDTTCELFYIAPVPLAANYPELLQLVVIKRHGMILDDKDNQTPVLPDYSGRDINSGE